MGSFRENAPPWSFFIPVTLAVIVGVLAADAIRSAIDAVLGADETPPQLDAAPPAAPEALAPAVADVAGDPVPSAAPAGAGEEERTAAVAPPPADTPAERPLELPDSMTARRDGDPAACVNGSVAKRVEGGWEQVLENDAPVPCVIANPDTGH